MSGEGMFWICLFFIGFFIVLIPGLIASKRKHAYKGIIWVLGIVGLVNGVTWLIAIIWALWPQDKSLADPVIGNVTGTGTKNIGDTFGAASVGYDEGITDEQYLRNELKNAQKLRDEGLISESEFQKKREKLLKL